MHKASEMSRSIRNRGRTRLIRPRNKVSQKIHDRITIGLMMPVLWIFRRWSREQVAYWKCKTGRLTFVMMPVLWIFRRWSRTEVAYKKCTTEQLTFVLSMSPGT